MSARVPTPRPSLAPSSTRAGIWEPPLDYVIKGAAEGLDPHPLFDTAHYRKQRHGGLRGDALTDFMTSGARAQASPTPHFKPAFYSEQANDRPQTQANALLHYLTR